GVSLWRCAHNLLSGLHFADPYNTSLLSLLRRQDTYQPYFSNPSQAFEAAQRLKHSWLYTFSGGIPMPQAVVHITAAQTSHQHVISNATLQLPHSLSPHSYSVYLPTVRVGQVQWFYLELRNPFALPLVFSLHDDLGSNSVAATRGLKNLHFSPLPVEQSKTHPVQWKGVAAASRFQCPPPDTDPTAGGEWGQGGQGGQGGQEPGERNTSDPPAIRYPPVPCTCAPRYGQGTEEAYCEAYLALKSAANSSTAAKSVWRRASGLSVVRGAVVYHSSSRHIAHAGVAVMLPSVGGAEVNSISPVSRGWAVGG
ncbi:hypothetical protein B484DRAFT_390819, partial [Ochromonadaceae sp. CCMP2298]